MSTTRDLLNDYIELRNAIAEFGPNDRLLAERRLYEVAMEAHRVEQEYLALKARYPDPIEFLELATPLTAAQLQDLDAAEAVDKEIEKLLSVSRAGDNDAKH